MIVFSKLISGGQTGCDQAALDAALERGFDVGGWCPPKRESEDGPIPDKYPLTPTPKDRSPSAKNTPRSLRTEWNVRDSDATLILRPEESETADRGTDWTATCASRYAKPMLVVDPSDDESESAIRDWLLLLKIRVLNVAGPSEGTAPGIGQKVYALMTRVLDREKLDLAEDSNKVQTDNTIPSDLPWWLAILHWLFRSRDGFLRFLSLLIILTLFLGVMLFAGIKLFNLRVVAGQVYLGGQRPVLGAHVTVDATAGFQHVGIYIKKGEKLKLNPEGRIHIAMDHAHNLATVVKGILINNTEGKDFADDIKKRYPNPPLDGSIVFYRDWCGPEGETPFSDLLEECKLRKEHPWGALMVVVLPSEVSARADPLEVLKSNKLTPQSLTLVKGETEFVADRDGWLTFIINEAILSPHSTSEDSKKYYESLKAIAGTLTGDPRQRITLRSIPLIWYADNNGAFRIVVTPTQ